MKQGKFIVFEGLEGAGKSTAIRYVESLLQQHHISYIKTREPGGTPVGEAIRKVFKTHDPDEPLEPKTELLLLYAGRLQHIEYKIKPALAKGQWVLCDRFELSTLAYQVAGRGLDLDFAKTLSAYCVGDFKPDVTLFLDIPPHQGLERVKARGAIDRIEQEGLSFFQKVNAGYHAEIKNMSDVIKINAALPLKAVENQLTDALSTLINAST